MEKFTKVYEENKHDIERTSKDFNISEIGLKEMFELMKTPCSVAISTMQKEHAANIKLIEDESRVTAMYSGYTNKIYPVLQLVVLSEKEKYLFSFSPFEAYAISCGGELKLDDRAKNVLTKKMIKLFRSKYGEKYEKALRLYYSNFKLIECDQIQEEANRKKEELEKACEDILSM